MKSTVNERVKLLRTHLNLSQQQFANRFGRTTASVSRIENGESTPRMSTLNEIISTFGVNKDWLLNGEGEMEISEKQKTSKESWKDKAYEEASKRAEHLEMEVQFLRDMLTNITSKLGAANFNSAFGLVGLLNEKTIESVRPAA